MSELALISERHRSIKRDPEDVRAHVLYVRPGGPRATTRPKSHVLAIPWIRAQPSYTDCAGESVAGRIDGVSVGSGDPWCSGVGLWRGARVRDGYSIEDLNEGTTLASITTELEHRGWDAYEPGEEQNDPHASRQDTVEADMFAADHRVSVHRRIEPGDYESLVEALLTPRAAVVFGSGLDPAYMRYVGDLRAPMPSAIPDGMIGGEDYGHAQGFAGYWDDTPTGEPWLLVQNSWTVRWGGCRLPVGAWQDGCAWLPASSLANLWDIHMVIVP